jgi:hypothetical protein
MTRTLIVYAKDGPDWVSEGQIAVVRDDAADLYHALCADTVILARALSGTNAIWAGRGAPRSPKRSGGIAVRPLVHSGWSGVSEAFSAVLAEAMLPTVMITNDTPHLPLSRLRDAFTRLDDGADLVLGPAEDGTVYLIGLCKPLPRLFSNMPSHREQWARTLQQRAREQGLRLTNLPGWYRINGFDNLYRLREDLRVMPPDVAVHTRAFLEQGLDRAQAVGG